MRKTLVFIALLLLSNLINAQSGEWRFLYGEKISSKWGQKPPYSIPSDDIAIGILEIKPLNLGSSSIIYSRKLISKLDWSLGIHYNLKGFREIGVIHDFGAKYDYRNNKIMHFIGILAGFRYNFLKKDTWKLGVETFINPEIQIISTYSLKKIPISSMSLFYAEKSINRHLAIVVNPFFETSLMHYNKISGIFGSSEYTPYGYGLMIGIKYNK